MALALSCGAPELPPAAVGPAAPPERPAACRTVSPGNDLQALLDAATPGEAFCLEPGEYPGPLRVHRRVVLWGPREAVVRAQGGGTTVRLAAVGAELLGLSIDGSGGRFDLLDAAVRVDADDVRVEGISVRNALFGVLVEQVRRVRLRNNEIVGNAQAPLGMRGDAIRLWEVRDSIIEGNDLRDGRDLVVWYSPGNRILANEVSGGRYGTHLMYSHDNTIARNLYDGNVVGLFLMYSRGIRVHHNTLSNAGGAAGMGLGAKESGGLEVVGNLISRNTVGVYLDTSPLDPRLHNRFRGNAFLQSDAAVVFHGGAAGNTFSGNEFRANEVPVRVEGRGSATDAVWRENLFDDYAGYDLDRDGFGDVAYELRSLSQELTAREPALRFFRGTPALGLVELVGRIVPTLQPRLILEDPRPRMRPLGEARGAG